MKIRALGLRLSAAPAESPRLHGYSVVLHDSTGKGTNSTSSQRNDAELNPYGISITQLVPLITKNPAFQTS